MILTTSYLDQNFHCYFVNPSNIFGEKISVSIIVDSFNFIPLFFFFYILLVRHIFNLRKFAVFF